MHGTSRVERQGTLKWHGQESKLLIPEPGWNALPAEKQEFQKNQLVKVLFSPHLQTYNVLRITSKIQLQGTEMSCTKPLVQPRCLWLYQIMIPFKWCLKLPYISLIIRQRKKRIKMLLATFKWQRELMLQYLAANFAWEAHPYTWLSYFVQLLWEAHTWVCLYHLICITFLKTHLCFFWLVLNLFWLKQWVPVWCELSEVPKTLRGPLRLLRATVHPSFRHLSWLSSMILQAMPISMADSTLSPIGSSSWPCCVSQLCCSGSKFIYQSFKCRQIL